MALAKEQVRRFFEDDFISTISPNKSDQIVRKKNKKQKRFLNSSLKYLFVKKMILMFHSVAFVQ